MPAFSASWRIRVEDPPSSKNTAVHAIKSYPHPSTSPGFGEAKVREFEYWKNFGAGFLS